MLQERAVEYFQTLHKKGEHLCVIVWQADDVIGQANERGEKCSKKEADEILDLMEQHHDAEYGISWETVNSHIDDLSERHEREEQEKNAKEKIQID